MFCEPRQSCSWHLFMSTLIISSFILTAAGAAATVATSSTPHRRLISFSTLKKLCTWKTSKKKNIKVVNTSNDERWRVIINSNLSLWGDFQLKKSSSDKFMTKKSSARLYDEWRGAERHHLERKTWFNYENFLGYQEKI